MQIAILNELPKKQKAVELSLTTIPTSPQGIQGLYSDPDVQSQFKDFDKNTSISATVNDLLQAVDLIALAYQTSYDNGLKCAPSVAKIKTDYLGLVGDSASTILNFKQKSQDAIFKLATAGNYLNLIKSKVIPDVSELENYLIKLDALIEASKEAEEEDFQTLYNQLGKVQDALGLKKDPDQEASKFAFKLYTNAVKVDIGALISGANKSIEQIGMLFNACINEIADCSRFATEMEEDTNVLITKTTALYDNAEDAFKACVEQDVTEKERKRQLEEETAKMKVRQAELGKREKELEEDIKDVLEEEKKIEKKLEQASSRAFWSSVLGAIGSAVGAGLNAYANYQTAGMSQAGASARLQEKVDQAEKEVEKKKTELKEAKSADKEAKEKYDALQGQYDVLNEKLKKTNNELKDLDDEFKTLETEKKEKTAELNKLEDSDENKVAREALQTEIAEIDVKIEANTKSRTELKKTQSEQSSDLELKKKEVKRAKIESEEKTRIVGSLGAAMTALSESMEKFHETAKTELEALSLKEDKIMTERRSLQKERRNVVSELAGLVVALKEADNSKKSLEQLINALRITSETMQKILVAFGRIKRFWAAIKDRCRVLAEKGATVQAAVKVASQAQQDEMMEVIDKVSRISLFQLVRAWAALSALNEATYEQLVLVTKNMEAAMTEKVDVQQLCDKLKIILEKEEKEIDQSLLEEGDS